MILHRSYEGVSKELPYLPPLRPNLSMDERLRSYIES